MPQEEVKSLAAVADTPPPEAAENVKGSQLYGINADTYKDVKEPLVAQTQLDQIPDTAPSVVVDRMAQSTQHAAVIKPDIANLNSLDRFTQFFKDTWEGKNLGRDLSNLQFKKAMGEQLTEDEQFKVADLTDRLNEINANQKDYHYNWAQSLLPEVVSGIHDFGRGLWENKKLIGGGVAAGAAIGGTAGFISPVPGGVAAGATIGGIEGGIVGADAAFIHDTFVQSTGQLYNDLGKSTDPNAAPLPEDQRRALAKGGGLLIGGVAALTAGAVNKNIPWVRDLISPSAFAKAAAASAPLRQFAIDMGKSGLITGLASGSQDAISIVTKELGNTWDGSQTKFMQAMRNAAANWDQHGPEIAKAAGAGFVGGAAFHGAATLVGKAGGEAVAQMRGEKFGGMRDVTPEPAPQLNPGQSEATAGGGEPAPSAPSDVIDITPRTPQEKGARALQLDALLQQATALTKDTETNKHLPQEMDIIRQKLVEQSGVKEVYVDKEDLGKWADSEEKAAKVRAAMDPDSVDSANLNAPVRFQVSKFMRLMDEHPELSKIAKADPESPTAAHWAAKLEEYKKAHEAGQEMPPLHEDIAGQEPYHDQPTFQPEHATIDPELAKANDEHLATRGELSNAVAESKSKDIEVVRDLPSETRDVVEREFRTQQVEAPEKVALVENFLGNTREVGQLNSFQEGQKLRGKPIYAINPDTLPSYLKSKYVDDPVLAQRGVFDKHGMDAESAAAAFGQEPAQLLQTLSETPTQAQAVKNGQAARQASKDLTITGHADLEHGSLAKAYDAVTKNHLKEMKFLKDKFGPINAPSEKFENLRVTSQAVVGSTKVGALKPNLWKVGERKSQSLAREAVAKQDMTTAHEEKLKAAANSQLAKETHIAVGKVNRAIKWIANLSTTEGRAELRAAGKIYGDAVDHILGTYGLDPSKQSNPDAYNKFVEEMKKEGKGDFSIPEKMSFDIGHPQSVNDLTVDQLSYLSDKLQSINFQAQMENELLDKVLSGAGTDNAVHTKETVASELAEGIRKHVNYDPNRNKRDNIQGLPSVFNFPGELISSGVNQLNNTQYITYQLDEGKTGGLANKHISEPLQRAAVKEVQMQVEIKKIYDASIEKYGKKEAMAWGSIRIKIPEFKEVDGLTETVTKLDLMKILANMGTESNKRYVENWGISSEKMFEVLKRELSQKDFDWMQDFVWAELKNLQEPIRKHELEVNGRDVEFIEPAGFEAFGKKYEGGYFPGQLKLKDKFDEASRLETIRKTTNTPGEKESSGLGGAFEGIVKTPYTIERVEQHKWVPNLDIDGISTAFDQIHHALAFAKPLRDVMTLLNDKDVAHAIKSSTDGKTYSTLVAHVQSLANSTSAINNALFSQHMFGLSKFLGILSGGEIIGFVAGSPTTAARHFESLFEAMRVMSEHKASNLPNSSKHLALSTMRVAHALLTGRYKEMVNEIAKFDAAAGSFVEGLEQYNSNSIQGLLPKKRAIGGQPWHLFRNAVDIQNKFLLHYLFGNIDMLGRVIIGDAAYNKYYSGEVPGVSKEDLQKMSPDEIRQGAHNYAMQVNQLTTNRPKPSDKSAIQRTPIGREGARLFNFARTIVNNRFQSNRNVSYDIKKAYRKAKDGDFKGSASDLLSAGDKVALMALLATAILAYRRSISNNHSDKKKTQLDGLWEFGKEVSGLNHIPIIGPTLYGLEHKDAPPSIPALEGLKDLAVTGRDGLHAIADLAGLTDFHHTLSQKEWKSVMSSTSIAIGGFPVNSFFKYKNIIAAPNEPNRAAPIGEAVKSTVGAIGDFIAKYDKTKPALTDDQLTEENLKKLENAPQTEMQQAVDQMKQLKNQLAPDQTSVKLHADDYEVLRHTISGDKWNNQNPDGGFGVYGFNTEKWTNIINSPEGRAAGLTEGGRVLKDSKQQQKAMEIETNSNIKSLTKMEVPVTLENLYFAHKFDVQKADILLKPDSTKVTGFPVGTVGELKHYLSDEINRGEVGRLKKE